VAGGTVTLTARFPNAVTVVGTPTLNLNTGGTASYVSGSGSNTLTFAYTVSSGDTPQANLAVIGSIPYKTVFGDFALENPISENGAWINRSQTIWFPSKTIGSPVRAVGTQPGGGTGDSYAHLQSGMASGAIQTAMGTVYQLPGITPAVHCEIELHSRWFDTSDIIRGYECCYNYNGGYVCIARWDFPTGFTTLIENDVVLAPETGDTFKCVTNGSTVTATINKHDGNGDQLLATATDSNPSPWIDGEVGMGFFIDGGATLTDQNNYGFTDYTATSGTTAINDGSGNQVKTSFMIKTFTGLGILQ
jgi:hypothetical protein